MGVAFPAARDSTYIRPQDGHFHITMAQAEFAREPRRLLLF